MKKYFIQTYGCQANINDSLHVEEHFKSLGYTPVTRLEDCDLFIINSCAVRQKSEDKVYGWGKKIKKLKNKPFVLLTGCVATSAMGERKRYDLTFLKNKIPWVDVFISAKDLIKEGALGASVNISYGCDNFCSYCVVPYAREAEISRPKKAILKEVRELVNMGVKKIMLCGQNVNSWGLTKAQKARVRVGSKQKLPFADLLREINDVEGLETIEFLSSNPFDFTDDLIDALKLPKISNYLHIAVQSGNNDILSKMNRRHTVEEFIALTKRIKKVRPDMTFGTDLIVGFPTETWEQFMDTVNLVKKVKFNVAFISMYSPRKGTTAAKLFTDDVPLTEKKRRHKYLTEVWKETCK